MLLRTQAAAAIPAPNADSHSSVLWCCIAGWESWACGGLTRSWHWGSGKLHWAEESQGQKLSEFRELQKPDVIDYLPPKRGVFSSFLNNCRDMRSGGDEIKVRVWLKGSKMSLLRGSLQLGMVLWQC